MEKHTRNIFIISAAVIATIAIVLTCILVPLLNVENEPQSVSKPLDLPVEERYALARYDYDSLTDSQVTLRADAFEVTKRNLPRAKTKLLSNTYTVQAVTGAGTFSQSIDFTAYPAESRALSQNDLEAAAIEYASENGIDVSTEDGLKKAKSAYFSFYKYMLLSQGTNLIKSYTSASRNGTLSAENVYKHPAADLQYGAVEGTDNAVEKVITLDPSYRSYHVTGLYLPAGEAVTVKAENLAQGEYLSIDVAINGSMGWNGDVSGEAAKSILSDMGLTPTSDFFTDADAIAASGRFYETYDESINKSPLVSSQWYRQNNRLPRLSMSFRISENKTYTVASPFGGIMHVGLGNCYSNAKLTFNGAVETPHYILGVTTPEYFDTYLRGAPGVYSAFDTENGQLIGKASYMRTVKTEEIDKLAMLWHSFFAVNETFSGGTYNRNNLVKFDTHVPAGAAVALGGMRYACPTSWFGSAMNYRGLINNGTWGILHEIGHSHASSYGTVWGFAGSMEGEVRNNALIALCYIMFLDIGTTRNTQNGNITAEHGFVAHPYTNLKQSLAVKAKAYADFNNGGYFEALSMYVNLMHSFGADKFYELLYSYKSVSSYAKEGAANAKRADFIYRCALVYGMDFRDYFNVFYSANVADESFTDEQLEEMKSYKKYEPVASLYAGGIDGVKTGGDYRVNASEVTTFDLNTNTLCDKPFEVTSVSKAKHGTLTKNGDVYSYTPNPKYFGTFDEFTYTVKVGDITHTFTVSLRISYNGSTLDDYGTVDTRSLDELNLTAPSSTSAATIAGVPTYNNNAKVSEVKTSSFYYAASRTGEHVFSVKGDDKIDLYFGETPNSLKRVMRMNNFNSNYNATAPFTVTLQSGKAYFFKMINLNTGGQGYARLGLKSGDSFSDVSASSIFPANFDVNYIQSVMSYAHEPEYIISKKDNVIVGSVSSDKSSWTVVEAPENIQGGRYATETFYDENDPSVIIGTVTVDKRDYLIDGQSGTLFHTTWNGAGIRPPTEAEPDVFIIDTAKVQPFNYFEIQTRNTADAKIIKYKLEISDDNVNYKTLMSADELAYNKGTARIEFTQTEGRYFKLSVMKTSGTRFTIIGELNCGSSAKTQLIVPSTASKFFLTDKWTATKDISGTAPGMITTSRKNEKAVIKFIGERISLYSATGKDFGTARVIIDGKAVGEINLNGEAALKKLVFNYENLDNKEHTVEIITTTAKPFNLAFAGLSYASTLVNAPNIYAERALVIALTVVSILLALTVAFVLAVCFCPSLRSKVLSFANKRDKNKSDTANAATETNENSELKTPEPNSSAKSSSGRTATTAKSTRAKSTEDATVTKAKPKRAKTNPQTQDKRRGK